MATDFKQLLHVFFAKNQNTRAWKIKLLQEWETVIGNLKTKVVLEKIHDDTIVLGVYDSCWLQELYLLSPLILTTINANLDQPRIKHLRFKLTSPIKKIEDRQKTAHTSYKPIKIRALHLREEQALEKITDKDLRNALTRFLMKCLQEKV